MSGHEPRPAAEQGQRIPLPLPQRALSTPGHPALLFDGKSISYAALSAQADVLARRLSGVGVGEGDRVAALLPNGLELVAALHACGRVGAILVPLNTRLTAGEIAFQVGNTTPRVMLVARCFAEAIREVTRGPDEGGGFDERRGPRLLWADGSVAGAASHPALSLRETVATDAAQAIVHTSGTTGSPKGAILTWGNQAWSAAGSALRLGAAEGDRWLAVLPLFHVGGLAILLRAAWQGSSVVVHERFDAAAAWRSMHEESITMVSLVPTMLARLLEIGEAEGAVGPPASLRAALIGGGAAPEALLSRAVAAGWPLAPTYGLTEACSQVATCAPGWRPEDGLAAPPLPYTQVRVLEHGDGAQADGAGMSGPEATGSDRSAFGAEGEIVVRGPTVFAGYWRDAASTERAKDAAGWLRTGDWGRIDARGCVAVSGRRSDLIVTGGENVYPAEVEAALVTHPDVAEACVVGVPDPEWGQRVVAAVVGRRNPAGVAIDAEAVLAQVRLKLAGFKVPRELRVVDRLPRTASGKVRRVAVRDSWGS